MRVLAGSFAEMLSSFRNRAGQSPDEVTAERLLAGESLDCEATASQRTLELVLAAAAGPPVERELAGETAAVARFVAVRAERRKAWQPIQQRVPAAAVTAVLVVLVALCGTAEAGVLPAPLQRLAHRAIDAPAPAGPTAPPSRVRQATPGPATSGSNPNGPSAPAAGKKARGAATSSPAATRSGGSQGNNSQGNNSQGNGDSGNNGNGNGNGQDGNNGSGQGNSSQSSGSGQRNSAAGNGSSNSNSQGNSGAGSANSNSQAIRGQRSGTSKSNGGGASQAGARTRQAAGGGSGLGTGTGRGSATGYGGAFGDQPAGKTAWYRLRPARLSAGNSRAPGNWSAWPDHPIG